MASVAALQCVERGLLSLDDPVETILPELKNPQILLKMDAKTGPTLKAATKKITLRQMLTHSSGLSYEFTHPKMFVWRYWFLKQNAENKALTKSLDPAKAYQAPLLFEPGEGWAYSTGIDWAGIMVSRVTGKSLEGFMQENIFKPLGMSSTTFYPERYPKIADRLANMAVRDEKTGKLDKNAGNPLKAYMNVREGGGGGCFSTANDYMKFLSALCSPVCPLFTKQETLQIMFSPNLSPPAKAALMEMQKSPEAFGLVGNVPIGTDLDFGLGGLLNMEKVKGSGRAAGSMQWGGLPNLMWWVNRKDGICGCYFSQLLPSGDRRSFDLYEGYEKAGMEEFGMSASKL
ncbi:beta-lactamase/transpeptidase-like protein [Tothia fuscella]|uniref:Beta-lactamase/transpeptidase-like protein n=1 Tax=Tothia fuscella TaxID=1048955 RepID=A0A9P4NKS3_9PEZI|nr:beta-lactamase/transpeptidase-like protein [Tothia fuscella]